MDNKTYIAGSNQQKEETLVNITRKAEKIMTCFTFRMLEKVIDKAAHNGELKFSILPDTVVKDVRSVKLILEKGVCNDENLNDRDLWLISKAVNVLEDQGSLAINKYHSTFCDLIAELNITDEFSFAYERFVEVSKKLFTNDNISWSHIVTLLCFGVEISVFIIEHGKPGLESFLQKINKYVMDFFIKEEIMNWIEEHGGWITMIDFFDDPNCPERPNHILAAMAISEMTNFEVWLHRFFVATLLSGIVIFAWRRIAK